MMEIVPIDKAYPKLKANTDYLVVRNDNDSVCLARYTLEEGGSFPTAKLYALIM